jgi:3-deoxy-D-manno-octulosonic-acid transferase
VTADLDKAEFLVKLRSTALTATGDRRHVFVIDSTGELRDWTAHADVVIIGKSFLASGGQNPSEAILAHKPVIFGPHMENFQPLADRLIAAGGCIRALDETELRKAIVTALDPSKAKAMIGGAARILERHEGATQRIIALLSALFTPAN